MVAVGTFLGLLELLGDAVPTSKQLGSAAAEFHNMVSQYLLFVSSPEGEGGGRSAIIGSDGVTVPGGVQ